MLESTGNNARELPACGRVLYSTDSLRARRRHPYIGIFVKVLAVFWELYQYIEEKNMIYNHGKMIE